MLRPRLPLLGLASATGLAALVALGPACGDDTGEDATTTSTTTTSDGGSGAGTSDGGAGGDGSTSSSGGGGVGGDGAGGDGGSGGAPCATLPPVETNPPDLLSETGLYTDISTLEIGTYIRQFTPQYALWSDAATKDRFAYIPECTQIDTTDMDYWDLPIGSRFWKEFTRDGVRIETRMLTRNAAGTWRFVAYHWDGSGDAVRIDAGLENANGTGHDIPAQTECSVCHKPDWRVLGFSAFQLTGETLASLEAEGLFTVPPQVGGYPVPGTPAEQAALGYLHANCGNCHYDGGVNIISMHLKLLVDQTTVATTDTFVTSVNQPTTNFNCGGCDRIEPGNAAASAVFQRMNTRGTSDQMPPLATEIVDATGVAAVSNWINSL